MKAKVEEIFDKLLAEVRQGKSIDDCLREYPDYAEELKPLLYLASSIDALPRPEPDVEAVDVTVRKARAILREEKESKAFSLRNVFLLRPVVIRVFAVALLILALGATTVTLSANSLPGDALYPVKIATERVQLFLTTDTKGKAKLHLVYADKRTDEFVSLLTPGVKINEDLLAQMLHETELAIDCAELLDEETIRQIIHKIEECNENQMDVLEKARDCACEGDIAIIEKAIQECLNQHKCIDCLKNPDVSNGHCPCP